MSHYDSDTSTLVGEDRPRRQKRYDHQRSSSGEWRDSRPTYADHDPYDPAFQNFGIDKSKLLTAGKVAVVVGIVGLLLHKWRKENEARKREEGHRRRRDFERAKHERRKEEERREREEEELAHTRSPPQYVRRIEYFPESPRAKSRSGRARSDQGSEASSESSRHTSHTDSRDIARRSRGR